LKRYLAYKISSDVLLLLEAWLVDWGIGCTKILFLHLDIKPANCGRPDDKQTQCSAHSVSKNKYLIWFDCAYQVILSVAPIKWSPQLRLSSDPLSCAYQVILSVAPIKWSSQLRLSTDPLSCAYQLILSVAHINWSSQLRISTDPLSYAYQLILSVAPINLSSQLRLSTDPLSCAYQLILAVAPINWSSQLRLSSDPLSCAYQLILSVAPIKWSSQLRLSTDPLSYAYQLILSVSRFPTEIFKTMLNSQSNINMFLFKATCFDLDIDHHHSKICTIIKSQVKNAIYKQHNLYGIPQFYNYRNDVLYIYVMQTNVHCFMLFNTIFIKCCPTCFYKNCVK
jgi:hypothetical protein